MVCAVLTKAKGAEEICSLRGCGCRRRAATSPEKPAEGRSPRASPGERAAKSARLHRAERSRDARGKVLPQQAVAQLARARLYSVAEDDPFRSGLLAKLRLYCQIPQFLRRRPCKSIWPQLIHSTPTP